MTVTIDKPSTTLRSSTSLVVDTTVGNLQTSVDFVDVETGSAVAVDGLIIPMLRDRADWIEDPDQSVIPQIDSATLHSNTHEGKTIYDIILNGDYPKFFRRPDKISIGSLAAGVATYQGALDVHKLFPTESPTHIQLATNNKYKANPNPIDPADLVGEYCYKTHAFAGAAILGLLSVNLATGIAGSGVLRLALVQTTNPGGGLTLQQRRDANEVIWDRFYPVGSQVGVDYSGLRIGFNGYYPFAGQAPVTGTGAEPRLMLCFYWETTTGTPPAALPIDVDLTYQIETVIEKNAL